MTSRLSGKESGLASIRFGVRGWGLQRRDDGPPTTAQRSRSETVLPPEPTITAAPDCGDLRAAFTCDHCPDCEHECLIIGS